MLASRNVRVGLRVLHNGKGRPLLKGASSRLYSQALQSARPSIRSSLSASLRPSPFLAPSAILQSCRHASTTPSPAPAPMTSSNTTVEGATSSSEWDALLEQASAAHIADIQPHIGYLKEIGLDYGWGPTAFMQYLLENVYVFSSLPWWASMLTVAYTTRLLLLRLHVRAADHAARMAHVSPHLKPLQEKMKAAQAANDTPAVAAATQELKATMEAAGVRPLLMFLPIIIQGFLGFGMFRLTAGMSRLPVPGFETGGLLWFQDLTVCDPFYILPVLSGATMWYTIKRGGETGTTQMNPVMMKFALYVLPGMTTIIFLTMPAGMQYLAFLTAAWSLVQGTLLRNPAIRRFVGITPLPPPRPAAAAAAAGGQASPYPGTLNAYRTPDAVAKDSTLGARWRRFRAPMDDWMQDRQKGRKTTRLSARDQDKARQYERERRAEIDAARERYLDKQRKGKK